MDISEILKEIRMTYYDMQNYLLEKYGAAVYDYFATPDCNSKSKRISRTSEGLICHHMDEDKGVNLSNPPEARRQPYEWQRKERLVYCNILEHLILHMKIGVLRQNRELREPMDIDRFFTTGGIYMICHDINDMFMNDGTSVAWKKNCFRMIEENYADYILLIKALMVYIEKSYKGAKTTERFLKPGSFVHFSDCDCEILKLSSKRDSFLLKLPNGEETSFGVYSAYMQFTYSDCIDNQFRILASGFKDFYDKIYYDYINCPHTSIVDEYVDALSVDFSEEEFVWGVRAIDSVGSKGD